MYEHVIVIVAVWGNANGRTGGALPSSFTQNVFGNNQSPDTFVEGVSNCKLYHGAFRHRQTFSVEHAALQVLMSH
jgi:hypothetical protein